MREKVASQSLTIAIFKQSSFWLLSINISYDNNNLIKDPTISSIEACSPWVRY